MQLNERYEHIVDALMPYKDDEDIYITFSDLLKVGINPQSKHDTPIGIYAYPLKKIWQDVENDTIPFGDKRPHVHVLRADPSKITDVSDYDLVFYDRDKEALKSIYDAIVEKFGLLNQWDEDVKRWEDEAIPDYLIAAKMWNVSRNIAAMMSHEYIKRRDLPKKFPPAIWNWILRRIGYEGISDKRGIGLIHPNEPQQAVFLSIRPIRLIATIDNVRKIKTKIKLTNFQQFGHRIGENNYISTALVKEWPILVATGNSTHFTYKPSNDSDDSFAWFFLMLCRHNDARKLTGPILHAIHLANMGKIAKKEVADGIWAVLKDKLSIHTSEYRFIEVMSLLTNIKVMSFLDGVLGASEGELPSKTMARLILLLGTNTTWSPKVRRKYEEIKPIALKIVGPDWMKKR